jgi:Acetyltransferases
MYEKSVGTSDQNYLIREIQPREYPLLQDFLYEAIFQRDENNKLPKEIINEPSIKVYIENFGTKPHDYCLCAEVDKKIVGAVWTRIIDGFGHIDNATPEFAISLYNEYRRQGIGTTLMQKMLDLLAEKGYKKTSLAVQKDNYAVKMYKKVGFKIISETEEEYIMECKLQ